MTISNELIHNERVCSIVNSEYKDYEFINLMREVTLESVELNPKYREIVNKSGFKIDDLNVVDDLSEIPYIPAVLFKESAKEELLKRT